MRRTPNARARQRALSAFRRRAAVDASSSTASARSIASSRSTRSRSPRMARPPRCSMPTGDLALPVLDYEHDGPERLAADYDAVRPPFAETGTPRLPVGLNLGAQLFWQQQSLSRRSSRTVAAHPDVPAILGLPADRRAANEVTSLGCHTDLWNPRRRDFSSLVDTDGMAPADGAGAPAGDRLGPILPDVAVGNRARSRHAGPSAASTIPTPRCCRISCRPAKPFRRRLDRHMGHRHGGRRQAASISIRRATRWSMSTRSARRCRRPASWAAANSRRWSAKACRHRLRRSDRSTCWQTPILLTAVGAARLRAVSERRAELDRRRADRRRPRTSPRRSIWR